MPGQCSQWRPEVPSLETRKTFVLWVSREPAGGSGSAELEGRLEEVDTGLELRFRSTEELIAFIGKCLEENK